VLERRECERREGLLALTVWSGYKSERELGYN
jgi:hypothetical protein